MRRRLAKKLAKKKEAKEMIPGLLDESIRYYKAGNKVRSHTLAKKIRFLYMKYKIRLPYSIKRRLCKHCYQVLIPSVNCRVRVGRAQITILCHDCKHITRIGIPKNSTTSK